MLDADSLARLRRALGSFRGPGAVEMFRDRFVRGCLDNGYDGAFAESCFRQLQGFFGYGFPESHAASFALLAYASAWLKRNHPEAFACALLNAQPMGFYAPAQIVRDARKHGVDVRPVCIERSYWDQVLEPSADGGLAVRLGFRQIKASASRTGSGSPPPAATDTARSTRCGVGPASPGRTHSWSTDLAAGTRCGRSRGWCRASAAAVRADRRGPAGGSGPLPPMSAWQEVFEDHVSMRLSLQEYPVSLLAPALGPVLDAAEIRNTPDGAWVTVAGLVMPRQRPSTASEAILITREDQTTPALPASWSGRRHSRSTSGKSWPGGDSASAAGSSAKGSSPTWSHQGWGTCPFCSPPSAVRHPAPPVSASSGRRRHRTACLRRREPAPAVGSSHVGAATRRLGCWRKASSRTSEDAVRQPQFPLTGDVAAAAAAGARQHPAPVCMRAWTSTRQGRSDRCGQPDHAVGARVMPDGSRIGKAVPWWLGD